MARNDLFLSDCIPLASVSSSFALASCVANDTRSRNTTNSSVALSKSLDVLAAPKGKYRMRDIKSPVASTAHTIIIIPTAPAIAKSGKFAQEACGPKNLWWTLLIALRTCGNCMITKPTSISIRAILANLSPKASPNNFPVSLANSFAPTFFSFFFGLTVCFAPCYRLKARF